MRLLLLLILTVSLATNVTGQAPAKKIRSVEDVYRIYPERIDTLFQLLDLNREGFGKVKAALKKKDMKSACQELVSYYETAKTAQYLRKKQPMPSEKIHTEADSILNDLVTFYELTDRVPRTKTGQLDWSHQGPDKDIEWAWGLNRHGHLQTLLEAYFETGNPKYANGIDDHIQDWVVSSIPYPGVKSSTAMWRGLEVALRAKNWVRVFFALADSQHLSAATKLLMLTSLPEHIHYMRNFHAPAGNWLTMEMSGLAMVATAWPEFIKSRELVDYTKKQMLEGLKDQVYPDGVQKEMTSHYHQVAWYNFDHFLQIFDEAGEPLPDGYRKELEKMLNYTATTMRPTGYGILNNDSDKRYSRELVMEVAGPYNREDWLFIATNGKKGRRPSGPPSVFFPWAGQMIMRSGYDENAHWGFFDIGPWGTGHQHNDKLHLSIGAYGKDLLVDAGRFAYRGELARKFRRYATGSAGHNVILIDSAGQAAGPEVALKPISNDDYKITEQFDFASSSFDAFSGIEGKSKHSRSVFYMRGKFWIVVDRVETDRPRNIQALWHWHPDIDVATEANGVVSTREEKGNLNVVPVGNTAWKIQHIKGQEKPTPQGWYSEKYNVSEPAMATIYSTQIPGSTSFVWILQPSEHSAAPVKAEVLSQDGKKVVLRIRDDKSNQWEVTVPFADSKLASYSFRSASSHLIESDVKRSLAEEVNILLSRLDLNKRELAAVRRSKNDPAKAAEALLAYYRSRKGVAHPIDREKRMSMRGKAATGKDLEEADNALNHIFIGQGAYPPYYCGDDIDWSHRPVPDNEWVWQLNRMGFWEAMGKAYWHTGDERYAREWALQLVDWTQKNPRDEAHAYAWRSIEAGIRGHRWTGLFHRFVDSPSFSPSVLVTFLNSCYDHASYLMTKYRKGSNWGLMEAEGMAFIAMTFPEFAEATTWRTEAIARLNAEIESQVYADGHQRELAMGYHTGSIGWFKRTLDLARLNGVEDAFPKTYLAIIEKMCEIPFKLGLPDGSSTQFGDSWAGEPGRLWPALKEWGQVFNRDDFLYVASEGKEGKKPVTTAFALEYSGFYSMRSAWDKDAICLVLKCGPDGGGHCQPDNGTFELYAGGRHLMPDAGSYIYSGDPQGRAWFRQTKVHQTLTLNEANSAYAPKLRLWKPGADLDMLVVENASYPDLVHRRAVFFVDKKFFVIVDDAIGNATGDVDIHFQFAPGRAILDSTYFTARTDFAEGWNVMVQSNAQNQMQMTEEEGWVSFLYTKKEKRPAFRYRVPKSSSEGVRFITVVVPYKGTTAPKVHARLSTESKPGDAKLALTVFADGVTREITCEIPDIEL